MRECLETHSDKLILSNSLCDLASIILKIIILRIGVKVPSKKKFCYCDQVRSCTF